MVGKRIVMVFIPLICMIGGMKANNNNKLVQRKSLNSYSETFLSDRAVIYHRYLEKNRSDSFSFGTGNTHFDSPFQTDSDESSLMGGGMDGDPSGGGMGEIPDGGGDGLGGDPSGPGVGEGEATVRDGLLILLSFACLYVFWRYRTQMTRKTRIVTENKTYSS